ncbi:MAG: zinc ribbon domain-containing protein [Phototrophicales bacterium]
MNTEIINLILIYAATTPAAAWLGMIIWTNKDIRRRTRDNFTQIIFTTIVAILNIPGLIIYLFLRPHETLAQAYERSLEEEALLQEIEEKPTCPGCGQRVEDNWQICAHCHTRLKEPCINCHKLLELTWQICPFCTASQTQTEQIIQTPNISLTRNKKAAPRINEEPLQFIDDDNY